MRLFTLLFGILVGAVLHHNLVKNHGLHNTFDNLVDHGEAVVKEKLGQTNAPQVAEVIGDKADDVAEQVSKTANEAANKVSDAAEKAATKTRRTVKKAAGAGADAAPEAEVN